MNFTNAHRRPKVLKRNTTSLNGKVQRQYKMKRDLLGPQNSTGKMQAKKTMELQIWTTFHGKKRLIGWNQEPGRRKQEKHSWAEVEWRTVQHLSRQTSKLLWISNCCVPYIFSLSKQKSLYLFIICLSHHYMLYMWGVENLGLWFLYLHIKRNSVYTQRASSILRPK